MALEAIFVGNAIVDMVATGQDSFLTDNHIEKGAMNLIDEDRAVHLSSQMTDATTMAGGSAANSAVGFALLGGQSGYVGEVAEDSLGEDFIASVEQTGVTFLGKVTNDGLATARSMIFVTPDAVRSMNTFLGACIQMGPSHLAICLLPMSIISKAIYLMHQKACLLAKVVEIAAQQGVKSPYHSRPMVRRTSF